MWFGSSEQAGALQLITSLEESVQAFGRSGFVQLALLEWRLCGEILDVLWADEIGEGGEA